MSSAICVQFLNLLLLCIYLCIYYSLVIIYIASDSAQTNEGTTKNKCSIPLPFKNEIQFTYSQQQSITQRNQHFLPISFELQPLTVKIISPNIASNICNKCDGRSDIHFSILFRIQINFYMKQGKGKKIQPKKVNLMDSTAATNHHDNTNKQPSGHTKVSTNYTVHSITYHNPSVAKKNKKNTHKHIKENLLRNQPLPTSKSTKKFKINLQQESRACNETEESYREYCLVDEKFIPITCPDDKQKLEDILAHTASTDIAYPKKTHCFPTYHLRQRMNSRIPSRREFYPPVIERIDISTSVHEEKKVLVEGEANAVVEQKQIGLQYSQRYAQAKEIIKEQNLQAPKEGESLSQLLFKLQFSHLADQKSFARLSSNQKQHFSQLLQTLISKLKTSKPSIKPIDFSTNNSPNKPQQCEYRHPRQQEQQEREAVACGEQLQKLVCLREYQQMNWIEYNAQVSGENQVNTSMFSVVNFLCHLFCYIEVQYSEELVYMIQKVYGPTFREKYRRITRRIPLIPDRKFRVIDESIFLDFINESNSFSNPNEIVHFKAIFDSFNEHLQEYRPFYLGNGEQFPWAFKMLISMSEYAINEESLQIIFLQSKEKMIEWCSHLCGLMVDYPAKMGEENALEKKRKEREEKMVRGWLKEENFEKDGTELYSTQALHDAAESIYEQLLAEFTRQFIHF